MLKRVGVNSVAELFSDVPASFLLKRKLGIPEGQAESSVRRELSEKLSPNRTPPETLCFLGGGVWPHYVPAAVDSIVSRQEFYTSYTPYQPEVSQGMLQSLFEYQSMLCDLLGMEVCNSSMYDWASAAGEAVRMAARLTARKTVLVAENISPQRLAVIKTYTEPLGLRLRTVKFVRESGELDLSPLDSELNQEVAGIYVENPNYFGVIEERIADVFNQIHGLGGICVVGVDPTSLAVIAEPGSYGADVVVGEGQPLGIPMNYGGPHIGIFGVRDISIARSMPGRLIGLTTVKETNQRAFSMVLQTREQHIRREGATSNICTNQALMALAVASYLSLLGKRGFRRLGEVIVENSHYAAERISRIPGCKAPLFSGPFFKEFAVGYGRKKASHVYTNLARKGVLAGYPISKDFGVGEAGLYCVTEVHSSDDINRLVTAMRAT
ncbi:MAG: aminomethyl-transferring glycine dehydrogenase subunit GcvPA [Thaumarchaeota archaeon]|nr:aminomethyl-transferring glycine dehydrogenase subunit GcvPA [Nitrososphaerota archaeon]